VAQILPRKPLNSYESYETPLGFTLALRHAMPTIYQYREFAAAGGLMSYGGLNSYESYETPLAFTKVPKSFGNQRAVICFA
jgi:hypothetical protein